MFFIYSFIVRLFAPFIWVLALVRAVFGREEFARLSERRGVTGFARPSGPVFWVHAASVGETRSVLPLVRALLDQNPDLTCLITTVTVTGARTIERSGLSRVVHQYAPFDHPVWVARFLKYWNPCAVLWLESEFWPVTLTQIKSHNLPAALVNGRLSARSAARWALFPAFIRRMLSCFDVCLAQSADDAARLTLLGAAHVSAPGNLKYAGVALPFDPAALESLQRDIGPRPLLLFASTHAGEEAIAIDAHRALCLKHPGLLSVVMPRHPNRGDDVAALFMKAGIPFARRSKNELLTHQTQIYLADTLGEPGLFYRLCPLVYLGNSLITTPGGGHNPIEPAQLGCAVVYGPHMWNFSEIDLALRAVCGSVLVQDTSALIQAFDLFLKDDDARQKLGSAALSFVATQNDVLEKSLMLLRPALLRAKITA